MIPIVSSIAVATSKPSVWQFMLDNKRVYGIISEDFDYGLELYFQSHDLNDEEDFYLELFDILSED